MTRPLIVSFGEGTPRPKNAQFATITRVDSLDWPAFASLLTAKPPESADKSSAGWFCPARFSAMHRDSEYLETREALTFDYDVIAPADIITIKTAFKDYEYAIYTTASHTAERPRLRVVLPLSRAITPDEFCAVSRRVAARAGIELAARESHVPAQMAYLPTVKPGAKFASKIHAGAWVDPDAVLAEYTDWTDQAQWPRRKDGDTTYKADELPQPPDEKQGIVGDFCRAFDCVAAIEKFDLPYQATGTTGRYTFSTGSRAEGAVIYDGGRKLHSHHDSDPARGQHNAFDLVRLHRFAALDAGVDEAVQITERPSYRAMAAFARDLPEVRARLADIEFDELPPLTAEEEAEGARLRPRQNRQTTPGFDQSDQQEGGGIDNGDRTEAGNTSRKARFRVIPAGEFATDVPLEWLIKSVLPKAELAVIYGESGSGKSFQALDLAAAVARGVAWRDHIVRKGRVVYVAAEGAGGFRQRLRAYARHHDVGLAELPGIVAAAPNLLDLEDSKELTIQILAAGGADLVIVDTLARAMAGNENSGEDMSRVIAHCKAIHKATGALVVFVHHSGKDTTKGARGWSGLRAAADAELEVTRNGDFRLLTVRKMKDGTDDMAWGFKLDIVGLGMDNDGDELSSCVVVPAEVRSSRARKEPTGAQQKTLLAVARDILQGTTKSVTELLQAAREKMPAPPEGVRDQRRQHSLRALEALVANQFLFLPTPDTVSLTSAVETHDEF